jgi:uncharacterized protein YjiS (DUF1127 family)
MSGFALCKPRPSRQPLAAAPTWHLASRGYRLPGQATPAAVTAPAGCSPASRYRVDHTGGNAERRGKCLPAVFVRWFERHCQRQSLQELDNHLLLDIGLTRAQANAEARKPFWIA